MPHSLEEMNIVLPLSELDDTREEQSQQDDRLPKDFFLRNTGKPLPDDQMKNFVGDLTRPQ
jgi:hypothetical protein